ncbi:MAG: nuclear transport factor 2 family protein [Chitinophagales bacterium]|nr:nuclear transport factor 2 family protein [Chitinophagales bacterium]
MKYHTYLIFACLMAIVSCNTSEKMDATSLQNFGEKYAEAWSSQDPQNLASFYAEDGWLQINDGIPAVGQTAIAVSAQAFMFAFPDMKVTMDSLVTNDTITAFHWTLNGTYKMNGNKVQISGMELWKLDTHGYITQSKGSYNQEEYDNQLKDSINGIGY